MTENNDFEYIEIKSITEFVKLINDRLTDSRKNYYYRGEHAYFPYRTPSLYLEEPLTYLGSEYYYRTLIKEMGEEVALDSVSLTRQLAERQHYGAKTRILDITTNPLVALFFAVDNNNGQDGYVYIYEEERREEKFDSGHTVAIKTALNFVDQAAISLFLLIFETLDEIPGFKIDDYSNLEQCSNAISTMVSMWNSLEANFDEGRELIKLEDGDYKFENNAFKFLKDEVEPFLHLRGSGREHLIKNISVAFISLFMNQLNQNAMVKEKLIYPYRVYQDIARSHIVFIGKSTERIRQQQGAFIYPRFVSTINKDYSKKEFDNIKSEINQSIEEKANRLVIKIKGEDKKIIRKELTKFGITEGYIYPDVQHKSQDILEVLKESYHNNTALNDEEVYG